MISRARNLNLMKTNFFQAYYYAQHNIIAAAGIINNSVFILLFIKCSVIITIRGIAEFTGIIFCERSISFRLIKIRA